MRIGEYLINEKIITEKQLQEALTLQETSPNLRLGEILVTMGAFTNKRLFRHLVSFFKETGVHVDDANNAEGGTKVWLTQKEIDKLIIEFEKEKTTPV